MRRAFRLLAIVALCYAGLLLFAVLAEARILYQPPPRPPTGQVASDELYVDGLALRFLPQADPAAPVLLVAHGNAEDLKTLRPGSEALHRQGWAVCDYDPPGYGASLGSPSEAGAYAAIQRAYRYLVETRGIAPQQVIVLGRSLGGGAAAHLAARQPIAGLILVSTFIDAHRVLLPVRLLPWQRYPVAKDLAAYDGPLLIIHGAADRTVSPTHARALAAIHPARTQLRLIDGAGHNDLEWVAGARYGQALADFAAACGLQPPAP